MNKIYLHIKGNAEQATAVLDAHGIHPTDRLSEVRTYEGCSSVYVRLECEPGVARWFCEPAELTMGFGYPAGTLLHYTAQREQYR